MGPGLSLRENRDDEDCSALIYLASLCSLEPTTPNGFNAPVPERE